MTQPLKGWRVFNFRTVLSKSKLVSSDKLPLVEKTYVPILISGVVRKIRTTRKAIDREIIKKTLDDPHNFWGTRSRKEEEDMLWNHRNSFYTFFGPIAKQPDQVVQLWNKNGFWGFKSEEEMMNQSMNSKLSNTYYALYAPVICEVTHFGKVLEFENTYRSSKMRIDKLFLRRVKVRKYCNKEFIEALRKRYQCEVDLT